MKKILSITLAVAFIFAAMSVSVFAATECTGIECNVCGNAGCTDHVEHVVGNGKNGTTHMGGYIAGEDVGSFTEATGSHNITINFDKGNTTNTGTSNGDPNGTNSVIVHKYAVDIEYNDLVIDMTKILGKIADNTNVENSGAGADSDSFKFVWDVNAHAYVLIREFDSNNDGFNEESIVDATNPLYETPYTIKAYRVINHSDLGIKYSDEIVSTDTLNKYYLGWESSIDNATDLTTDGCVPVSKATAATVGVDGSATISPVETTPGTPEWNEITATPTGANGWLDVVNAWGANNAEGNCVIGKLTITIKPNPAT